MSETHESQLLRVISLEPGVENMLTKALSKTPQGLEIQLNPNLRQQFFEALESAINYCWQEGYHRTVLLCDPRIRRQLHRLIERAYPRLSVLSYAEVAPGFKIEVVYTLTI